MTQCSYCVRFFERYRCNKPVECDCPKCQGMCECKNTLPLTDAELAELWHQANGQHYRYARLIEKAHGVKGRR